MLELDREKKSSSEWQSANVSMMFHNGTLQGRLGLFCSSSLPTAARVASIRVAWITVIR